MNRLAGLSILAVTLVATGSLAAQETGSTEPAPITTEKAAQPAEQAPAAVAAQVPVSKLPGDSHVRIVRLSQVQGKVGMDRGTGHGVEPSMQNMPIIEGLLLGTAKDDSYAEVEFEDGSTMRLGPGTAIGFTQLVTRATGAKATMVRVDRGTVYVSRENTKADEFTLVAAGAKKIAVQPSTHMRLELDDSKAEVAVFSGNVAVDGSGAPQMVGKKQTLRLDVADPSAQVEVAKKIEEGPYDGWDKDSQQYHGRYAKGNALLGGNGYGISDLNYYGSFATVGGCGTFWQPYFVSASWSPYATGMWARYAGGYSFVSPYPWGWLPFHSGGWSYCPSRGWGWQPGGSFVGVNNVALVQTLRGAPAHMPGGALPRPPADTRASMVEVNHQPLAISKPVSAESFVFQKDSAGLGVPRGSLGKLNGFSNDVARHGSANSHVYIAPAGSASQWNDGQVYHGPLALHRGSMPDEAQQAMWARQQAAATNGSLAGHHEGQLAAGTGRGGQPGVSQNPSAGWQGRQGQQGALNNNNSGNSLAWKNQQNGANASANANSSHSWNNTSAGAGAGTGAGTGNAHTWNNAGAGGGSGSGHTWNGGGNGGVAPGGGHTWSGGGGGQGANAGGGGSAGSSNSMGHTGGGGGGNSGGGGGGRSSGNGSK